MARQNISLLAFNRGIISPKALARVDLERTPLSAEVMTNWLPKTQGAMRLRPGTKHLGSSYNDSGAQYLEFVAATDDVALIELTHQKMRIWIDDELLGRPLVGTTLTLTDTGWSDASTGGAVSSSPTDVIPLFWGSYISGTADVSASSDNDFFGTGTQGLAHHAADNDDFTQWEDTGVGNNTLPSWWNIDFGTVVANRKAITSYSIRAGMLASDIDNAPKKWRLLTGNFDTGTYATDTGKWTLEDTQGSESSWAISERRTYTPAGADTGTIEARRHWRLYFVSNNNSADRLIISEIEMFTGAAAQQVKSEGARRIFNASSIGSLARLRKQVIVDTGDLDVEHSLVIYIERGPIILRIGSTTGDDDYITETALGTGYHNLAFTPSGNFNITLQHDGLVDRIVGSLTIGDSGTVEVQTDLDAENLDDVRYDQSADVVYVDADGVKTHKIERRGTGRSWSWVELNPDNGPFLPAASSSAKISINKRYGNAQLKSHIPFFRPTHVGSLFRLFHNGQSGIWNLGAKDEVTDAVEVTGIGDTGTPSVNSERRVVVSVTGTWSGSASVERSFDGPDFGFHLATPDFMALESATDSGTFTRTVDDKDDNVHVWYRVRIFSYSSGVAIITITYKGGGVNGIARVTRYNSNTNVDAEVLSRFSDTAGTDSWQEGAWSGAQQYPSSVALHGGRLMFAAGANLYASVADDYENFNDETDGDAAPIIRTLGSGPVDNVYYLISLLRLIIGTSGAEIELRSSSLDEPVTPSNSSARPFSTRGSANVRAIKMDTNAIFVQRSGQRLFMVGFGQGVDALGGYNSTELTILAPDLLEAGVVSIAIQRQPDTRIHCVLANGKVAILTYEPNENVICWSMWETDGLVEKAMVLPGTMEDQVYYHINRTINGATKRFLERWAMEAESNGDTGLSWLADCAASFTHATRSASLDAVAPHLVGESVIVWGDDTGQTHPGKDYSPDVVGVQTTYAVDTGGDVTLTGTDTVHHAVVGLPYTADWKSTKLAYAAEAGTALAQMKRVDKIAFVLYNTHNNGLFFGSDTGNLDALARMLDEGAQVDPRKIFATFDKAAMPFPGLWNEDSRICLRAKAPRPATVLAAIPTVQTNEKV